MTDEQCIGFLLGFLSAHTITLGSEADAVRAYSDMIHNDAYRAGIKDAVSLIRQAQRVIEAVTTSVDPDATEGQRYKARRVLDVARGVREDPASR